MGKIKNFKMRVLRLCVKGKTAFYVVLFLVILVALGDGVYNIGRWCKYAANYCYHAYVLDDLHDAYSYTIDLNDDYRFFENGSHSYIRNIHSRKKVLKDICWIVGIDHEEDSLLCFASGEYRGYFNRNTGEVAIPADRYRKAWIFSDGLAAVMEDDSIIKFINTAGELVIDKQFTYTPLPSHRGYCFINGYCLMRGANKQWGLIDKEGKWAALPAYDDIECTKKKYWICYKDGKQGLLNDSLRLLLQPEHLEVLVTDNGIEVLKNDYTRQLLDFNGQILQRFMYTDVRDLFYTSEVVDPDYEDYQYVLSPYKEYQTSYSAISPVRVGLLGPDGIPVTPPLFVSIEAVNANCFRCFYDEPGDYARGEGASILINTKGQVIEK